MRWIAGIVAAVVLLFVALFVVVDAFVQRDEVRSALEGLGEAALGRVFRYERLEVGLLPPGVVVVGPVFEGTDGVVAARAERVEVRVAVLPMLAGDLEIRGIHVDAGDIALVRTDQGVRLAGEPAAPLPDGAKGRGLGAGERTIQDLEVREQAVDDVEETSGARVEVRRITVEGTRVAFTDHTAEPPIELSFEDVGGEARLSAEPGPLELHARLSGGGSIGARGTLSSSGDGELHVVIDGLPVLVLQPFLGDDAHVEGSADVEGDVTLLAGAVTAVSGDMRSDGLLWEAGDSRLAGDVPMTLSLARDGADLAGTFALDATQASLRQSDVVDKPAGDALSLEGTMRLTAAGGIEVDGDPLQAGPVRGRLRLETEPALRTVLDTPPFEVAPLLGWLPGLSGVASKGRLSAQALATTFAPPAVAGALVIEGLGLDLASGSDARLDGRLLGHGTKIEGDGLVLHVAEQPFDADLAVDLAPGGLTTLDLRGEGLDSGAIFDALGAPPGMITGNGRLDGAFQLPREGEATALERLGGRLRVEIVDGRWKGVSLLEQLMGALSVLAKPLVALGGGRDLKRFYGDSFQSISGTFVVADGVATTDDLMIEYRTYVVDLDGTIGLVDQSLDMTGKLTMFTDVDEAIAGTLGTRTARVKRTIPLAGVKGTLEHPKVTVADHAIRAFVAGVLFSDEGEGLKKSIGSVLDALRGGEEE